jgi:glycerol uptake facilitator-like aquaporin
MLTSTQLDYVPAANCFFDEFIGTFALVFVIFAVTDKRNGPPPAGLVPLAIFVVVLGITAAYGMQTSFAINPARDLGPRIMTAMVGYGRGGTSPPLAGQNTSRSRAIQCSTIVHNSGSGARSAAPFLVLL